MSKKNPPRYTERFTIEHNRGPVRVSREMEIEIDLASIRRLMGLRAAMSMGRKSQSKFVKVRCVSEPGIISEATSKMMEVSCG